MAPLIANDSGGYTYTDTAGPAIPTPFIEPGEQELTYLVVMSFAVTLGLTPGEEAALTKEELAHTLVHNMERVPCADDIDKVELFERRVSAPSAVTALPEEGR